MTLCCGVNCVLKECSACIWIKQSKTNCRHGQKDAALSRVSASFLWQHYFYLISFPCVLIVYWFTHTNTQNSLHPLQYFHHLHSPLHSNCWHSIPVLILFIMQDQSLRITMQSNHSHILASTHRQCWACSNVSPVGLPPVLFLLLPPANACIIHPVYL
jgi:hypothetical protein